MIKCSMSGVRYKGRATALKPRISVGRSAYVSFNEAALEVLGRPPYVSIEFRDKYGSWLVFAPSFFAAQGHLKVAYTPLRTTGRVYLQGVRETFGLSLETGSSILTVNDGTLVWKLS
jgi:hypothetical protein